MKRGLKVKDMLEQIGYEIDVSSMKRGLKAKSTYLLGISFTDVVSMKRGLKAQHHTRILLYLLLYSMKRGLKGTILSPITTCIVSILNEKRIESLCT